MTIHFVIQMQAALEAGELSRGERRVVQFVLAAPDEAMRLPLAKLADAVGVSEPTVLRCCRKLGCSSLQEFRIKMAGAEAIGLPATHAAIPVGSSVSEIAARVLDFSVSNLDNLRRQIDGAALQRVVDIVAGARSLHFWGNGASGIVARDAQQKFPLFGIPCVAETDSHQILINAASLSAGDVVVVFSNTGRNSSMRPSVAAARANGAPVILITSSVDTPLAREASEVLSIPTLDNTDIYTPTISRIAALCIVDILSICVAQTRGNTGALKMKKMKEAIVKVFRDDAPAKIPGKCSEKT
ncbi:Transcriptional regulator, RpiR family [uncultured Pleomorphomonas sp.]|uniref:Transcriptional regulator, RpiR family n=2 Tax=uncultured Pleomorphomonas sp. TaxID=442121 RepID=A0A212LC37_9HYPH|nr:Transcriptional regulator, RpiR family [uncultured Pleomorphomonas sp.]